MYQEIIYLLCLNVLVIAPRTIFHGESSNSNEIQQEYLEELYDANFVRFLNSIPTLDTADVIFDNNEIQRLATECNNNQNCLTVKRASVKKYHQKMQAVQCVNALFVLNVLDELQAIMLQNNTTGALKNSLETPASVYKFYLNRMLSVLQLANWDPHAWQIEVFTFVSGLTASDAVFEQYKHHFLGEHLRLRAQVLTLVGRCVQHEYITFIGDTTPYVITSRCFVDNIYTAVDSLYKNQALDNYSRLERPNAPNLMTTQLHVRHKFIFDWSMFGVDLKTTNIESRLARFIELYGPEQTYYQWQLNPILGNRYNALVLDCIRLRCIYHVWFHLHTFLGVLRRQTVSNETEAVVRNEVFKMWTILVIPVKNALRNFRFKENIYWSAMRDMMAELDTISTNRLAAREQYTRDLFCRAAQDLGLARASEVDRQLKAYPISRYYSITYRRIEANAVMLDTYILGTTIAFHPFHDDSVRVLVSAETNETFISR